MPLPFILGAGAVAAGIAGVGSAAQGFKKVKNANDIKKETEEQHEQNINKFKRTSKDTNKKMDQLGELELEILKSFEEFSNTIEKIQNRPEFIDFNEADIEIPKYDFKTLHDVSVGASVLLGGLSGTAAGTIGGFAAAGAVTSAVMALGTASTGTAISSLGGAAAVNATLAALGGGSLAVGGGGIALGSTILSTTTLGIGFLVGGMIFNFAGKKLLNQTEKAYDQVEEEKREIRKICDYLKELEEIAIQYSNALCMVKKEYDKNFLQVSDVVNKQYKRNWNNFSKRTKEATENAILLVGLLYKMCQVGLIKKGEDERESDFNEINKSEINEMISDSEKLLTGKLKVSY